MTTETDRERHLTARQKTLRALLRAARIRRRRLIERLQFETREVKALTRALRATTRAESIGTALAKAGW